MSDATSARIRAAAATLGLRDEQLIAEAIDTYPPG